MPTLTTIEHDIRNVAVAAAQAAGRRQKQHFGNSPRVRKMHPHDIKLEMDRLSEEAIVDTILSEFSDHMILTEESGQIGKAFEYIWFVDPLDGTMNFSKGLHYFCTCIACYRVNSIDINPNPSHIKNMIQKGEPRTQDALGEPVVGVIYAPVLEELFVGVTGDGATLNGKPLRIQPMGGMKGAVVGVSLGSEEMTISRMERIVSLLVRRCLKLRLLGACGLDIANIAAGRLTALVQRRVRCWDFAAARVILEEAGGIVDAVEFAPDCWDVLACSPQLHDSMLEVLGDRT